MIVVHVQRDPFDAGAILSALAALGGGGVASFIGVVRTDDGVAALELEHHPTMTRAALLRLAEEAAARFGLVGATVIHRVGRMGAGEPIVLVATAAGHRQAALDGTAFLIDRLKTEAPFWKKEHLADGTARWVEAGRDDAEQAARWGNGAG